MSDENPTLAERAARAGRASMSERLRPVGPFEGPSAETIIAERDLARARGMAAHPAGKGRKAGEPYRGYCDGCDLRTLQIVRDVSGHWGRATVCSWHEHHA